MVDYGNWKLNEIFNDTFPNLGWAKRMDTQPYPDEMFEEAERREAENKRPFYRFFAIEYFATGEGMSFWLKVCRYHSPYKGRDYDLERFVKFIGEGADHYMHGVTFPTQEEFMTQYANLIPAYIVKMIERRDQPALDWETHFYFNYS